MSSRNAIQDELKSLGSSLPVTDNPFFSVPQGYFEELADSILAKVKASEILTPQAELNELSPLLAGIPKVTPYSVPSFYFEEALQTPADFEADIQSPVLAIIGKTLPYNVPADYFDSLPSEVLSRTSKSEAKVIPLFRRTWMRAAAVVIVAGGLVLGGLTIGQKSSKEDLAISQPQVTKSVAEVKPAIKQEIKKVSTSDLEAFVESVPANSSAPKKKSSAPEETKELLKDVSVNEMENFLAVVPQPDDELAAIDQP